MHKTNEVIQFDIYTGKKIGQFKSALEFAKTYGLNYSSVCSMCRNESSHVGEFSALYREQCTEENIKSLIAKNEIYVSCHLKKVIEIDLSGKSIGEWKSAAECSRCERLNTAVVVNCCKRKQLTYSLRVFLYDGYSISEEELCKIRKFCETAEFNNKNKLRRVVELDRMTGDVIRTWESSSECQKEIGVKQLYTRLDNTACHVKGRIILYEDLLTDEMVKKLLYGFRKINKKVVELSKEDFSVINRWDNILKCAEDTGIRYEKLKKCCRNAQNTVEGRIIKYEDSVDEFIGMCKFPKDLKNSEKRIYVIPTTVSLIEKYPDYVRFFDMERNKKHGIDVTKIHEQSQKYIYLLTENGISVKTRVAHLVEKMKKGSSAFSYMHITGYNDVGTLHSELMKDIWDFERNEKCGILQSNTFSTHTDFAYFKCYCCGRRINKRLLVANVIRKGYCMCKSCFFQSKTSFTEQSFFFYIRKLFPDAVNSYKDIFDKNMELDIFLPSKRIGIEIDGSVWHNHHHDRDNRKYEICKSNGVTLYRISDMETPNNCDRSFVVGKNVKVNDGMIRKVIEDMFGISLDFEIDLNRDTAEIMSLYKSRFVVNSLASLSTEISKIWDYDENFGLKPENIGRNTKGSFSFICPKHGKYKASPAGILSNVQFGNYGKITFCCPECRRETLMENNRIIPAILYEVENGNKTRFGSILELAEHFGLKSNRVSSHVDSFLYFKRGKYLIFRESTLNEGKITDEDIKKHIKENPPLIIMTKEEIINNILPKFNSFQHLVKDHNMYERIRRMGFLEEAKEILNIART